MDVKKVVLIMLNLMLSLSLYCQVVRIDSIINQYERKYRETLNNSDTLLIYELRDELVAGKMTLDSIINSKNYSNRFITELVIEVVKTNKCLNQIMDNFGYFNAIIDPGKNRQDFPVDYAAVESQEVKNILVGYLLESNYLSSCHFLVGKDFLYLCQLSYLLRDLEPKTVILNGCKEANIYILMNACKN
ncbi:MAG TPA: hypothetical protein PK147_00285 [Saprospiraceae bacterium]|nr:hypothetical protein [Saprospiraceae bacterium]